MEGKSQHTALARPVPLRIESEQYLTQPYAIPRIILILPVCLNRGLKIEFAFTATSIPITTNVVPPIHNKNGRFDSRSNSSSRLWAGSFIAPNAAISVAPTHTRSVPTSECRVNGSERMRVAHMELKTRPEAWRGERMTSGRVVIWMEEPRMFETMNRNIPI